MTKWVENPTGGRERGPVAIARAWTEVMVRPRRFFRTGVAPGDQAPGLVFAGLVVLVSEATRMALVADAYPVLPGQPIASRALLLALAVVVVTPAALHLTTALQTLILRPFVADRGGVSETVQVFAYATAPCVLAGVPVPALRVVCALYGSVLLVVGIDERHGVGFPTVVPLTAVPAAVIFGYGFRGFLAAEQVLDRAGYGWVVRELGATLAVLPGTF
ncbi:MAG: YIP1 family protein [Halorientalis sp.]